LAERKTFLVRIEPKLHDELRRWADDDLRSLNAQVGFLLRRAVKEWRGKEVDDDSSGAQSEKGDKR